MSIKAVKLSQRGWEVAQQMSDTQRQIEEIRRLLIRLGRHIPNQIGHGPPCIGCKCCLVDSFDPYYCAQCKYGFRP